MSGDRPVALYVHVPFCASRCAYCDFASEANTIDLPVGIPGAPRVNKRIARDLRPGATLGDAFVAQVVRALEESVQPSLLVRVPSVYLGGGTPTLLGERRMRSLLEGICDRIGAAPEIELTVEANPDSLAPSLIESIRDFWGSRFEDGVVRVSIGVQSFDDDVLETLGRRHDADAALDAVRMAVASGVRVSLDLICGVPGQSMASWTDSVKTALETGVGHVSIYPLTIEEGTPLARDVACGRVAEPESDMAAEMMEAADALLASAGLQRYEIANYARVGEESRHNQAYWTGVEYLGVGPSAASMFSVDSARDTYLERNLGLVSRQAASREGDASGISRVRFSQPRMVAEFLTCRFDAPPEQLEWLSTTEAVREDAMLGLRRSAGITPQLAESAGVTHVLDELADHGLVTLGDRWHLTHEGWLLGNEVFSRVWAGS